MEFALVGMEGDGWGKSAWELKGGVIMFYKLACYYMAI